MNAEDYSGYVISAYGLSALCLAMLGAWVAMNARARRREIRRLEEQGLRRRSAARAP